MTIARIHVVLTRTTFDKHLTSLRELGMQAWTLLFGARYAAREGASETIGELLKEMELKEGTLIQITKSPRDFIFPWSILHPPVADSEPVDPLQFWGARYQFEQVIDGPKNDLLTDEPINIVFVLDSGFGNSQEQETLLQKYQANAHEKLLVTQPISDEKTLFQELSRTPSAHLLYCYCHGYAPAGSNILRRDGVKLMQERIEDLKPDTPERQALETLLVLTAKMRDESWIYIGGAEITENRLKRQNFFERRRPIVFLNMCQSAELFPSMSSGLVRVFLDHNASAVVGTECPMTAVFASAFAEERVQRPIRRRRYRYGPLEVATPLPQSAAQSAGTCVHSLWSRCRSARDRSDHSTPHDFAARYRSNSQLVAIS